MGGYKIQTIDKLIEKILLALHQQEYEEAGKLIDELVSIDIEELESHKVAKFGMQIEYILSVLQEHKEQIKLQITKKRQLKNYLF